MPEVAAPTPTMYRWVSSARPPVTSEAKEGDVASVERVMTLTFSVPVAVRILVSPLGHCTQRGIGQPSHGRLVVAARVSWRTSNTLSLRRCFMCVTEKEAKDLKSSNVAYSSYNFF